MKRRDLNLLQRPRTSIDSLGIREKFGTNAAPSAAKVNTVLQNLTEQDDDTIGAKDTEENKFFE